MSLTTNNDSLQSILDAVNALPSAGSGGSGGSVETCTLTIEYENDMGDNGFVPEGAIVTLSGGSFTTTAISELPFVTSGKTTTGGSISVYSCVIENVVKYIPITLVNTTMAWEYGLAVSGNVERLEYYFGVNTLEVFQINGDGEIHFTIA